MGIRVVTSLRGASATMLLRRSLVWIPVVEVAAIGVSRTSGLTITVAVSRGIMELVLMRKLGLLIPLCKTDMAAAAAEDKCCPHEHNDFHCVLDQDEKEN